MACRGNDPGNRKFDKVADQGFGCVAVCEVAKKLGKNRISRKMVQQLDLTVGNERFGYMFILPPDEGGLAFPVIGFGNSQPDLRSPDRKGGLSGGNDRSRGMQRRRNVKRCNDRQFIFQQERLCIGGVIGLQRRRRLPLKLLNAHRGDATH